MKTDTSITVEELVGKLEGVALATNNPELAHMLADGWLLDFINDDRVTAAFQKIRKLYPD